MPKKFRFGGGNKCVICNKTVYVNEQVSFESKFYHKACFKCSICNKIISEVSSAGGMDGKLFHRNCFQTQFSRSGGRYGGEKVVKGGRSGATASPAKTNAAADAKKAEEAKAAAAAKAAADADAAAAAEAEAKAKAAAEAAEAEAAAAAKAAADAEAAAKKAAEAKAAEAKAAEAKAAKAKPAARVGSIDKSQPDKIFVENYNGKDQKGEPVMVEIPEGNLSTGIFIGKCTGPNLAVVITGKVKNLTISGCRDLGVVFDDCITTVELINCWKVAVQANNTGGSWVIDKSDRSTLYPPATSLADKVVVVSCMSTATNVTCPDANGEDFHEYAVPDQIQSIFKTGESPVHSVVIPDAE